MKERDVDYDAGLDRFAQAIARVKLSRERVDQMWERIRIALDDAQKVEKLIEDVFGPDARMVDQ